MRSVFGLITQLVWVNKDLKKACWDDINRKSVGPLIVRTIQGSLTNIINFAVTKFLPLTIIGVINNLGPPVTMVVAFFVLKEKIKAFEIVMITLTVGCILVIVIGGNKDSDES